ncbi:MAG: hypothetical protein KIT36_02315 [Alphaproteobacteria bacterium]|nr:hypothetical protein [Alphaproteobacteria bacterium]
MRLDLVVYDTHGKTRGYARLKLEFDREVWVVEEDAQRAWHNAGFADSGPIEMIDDDVIWLWEREVGNAKYNTVVVSGIAVDEADAGQSGTGRIVTGQVGRFNGGTVRWSVAEARQPVAPAGTLELVASRAAGASKLAEMPAY